MINKQVTYINENGWMEQITLNENVDLEKLNLCLWVQDEVMYRLNDAVEFNLKHKEFDHAMHNALVKKYNKIVANLKKKQSLGFIEIIEEVE